jgi:uncharacterized membrane protein
MRPSPDAGPQDPRHIAESIDENIEAVVAVHQRVERSLPTHQRGIARTVALVGRPMFLYLCMAMVAAWVVLNLAAVAAGLKPLDAAPFFWLQGAISLSSMLMTIMILISQNRQARLTEQRAHLDLQVNLLAERKIAKIVSLLEELRLDTPSVKDRYDSVAEAMKRPADPRQVIEALEAKLDLKR